MYSYICTWAGQVFNQVTPTDNYFTSKGKKESNSTAEYESIPKQIGYKALVAMIRIQKWTK